MIYPRAKLSQKDLTLTFSNLKFLQTLVSLHLIIPAGNKPPVEVMFLRVISDIVILGYVSHSDPNGYSMHPGPAPPGYFYCYGPI